MNTMVNERADSDCPRNRVVRGASRDADCVAVRMWSDIVCGA